MKLSIYALFALLLMTSCGGGTSKKTVLQQADSLRIELEEKDAIIGEIFESLGDITSNLNRIKERESVVTAAVDYAELRREPISGIREDIVVIDELLRQNKETIDRLEKSVSQLRSANVKVGNLEKLIVEMSIQVEAKDREITELKEEIRRGNVRIEELTGRVGELGTQIEELSTERERLEAQVNDREKELKTAYYIVGERKDLVSSKIVNKSGLFGGTLKLNENYPLDEMTQVNTDTFNEVIIGRRKIDIVTSHPAGSYQIVADEGGNVASIVILDKSRFWDLSKVLVISYK